MKPMLVSALPRVVLLAVLFAIVAVPATAMPGAAPPAATLQTQMATAAPADPRDPQQVQAFLDTFMAAHAAARVPGAAFAFVADRDVILLKGYGTAQVASAAPVDAEQTLFRMASISKLVTAVAVLQLVEQGQLDLDADVNDYLPGWRLPVAYGQPITLRQLLTHTSGLADPEIIATTDLTDQTPLDGYLQAHIPPRVLAPDVVPLYSNYGTALAGDIVAEIAGQPFEQYVAEHILAPLGMAHSSFQQPIPDELAAGLAAGYAYTQDGYQPMPAEHLHVAPAGALVATLSDMAQLMLALLNDGQWNDQRILQPESTALLSQASYTVDPRFPSVGLGNFQSTEHGVHILLHSGDLYGFSTLLVLLPDERVGYCLAFNGQEGADLRWEFHTAFLDTFYPQAETSLPRIQLADLRAFAGIYLPVAQFASPSTRWTSVYAARRVSVLGDALALDGGSRILYEPVGSILFQRVGDEGEEEWLAFRRDAQGRVTHLFLGTPREAYQRVSWFAGPSVRTWIRRWCLLIFGLAVLGWPVFLWLRRRCSSGERSIAPRDIWVAWAIAGVFLVSLLGDWALQRFTSIAKPGMWQLGLAIARLVALTAAPLWTLADALAANRGTWPLAVRAHWLLLVLTSLAYAGYLWYFRALLPTP